MDVTAADVLVVGGGIGGLAAAFALRRAGHDAGRGLRRLVRPRRQVSGVDVAGPALADVRPGPDRPLDPGRLILLGDAAHPMLQYLAQGACQAIQDAYELAAQAGVGRVDWPAALAATERVRAPRAARVQRAARLWGDVWHVDGLARLIRNEMLITREPQDYRRLDWLYA